MGTDRTHEPLAYVLEQILRSPPVEDEVDRLPRYLRGVLATGIEPEQVESAPALFRWSKFSSEGFSRIIDRCLAPDNSKEAITTLAAP
jgi:hypothetical protein